MAPTENLNTPVPDLGRMFLRTGSTGSWGCAPPGRQRLHMALHRTALIGQPGAGAPGRAIAFGRVLQDLRHAGQRLLHIGRLKSHPGLPGLLRRVGKVEGVWPHHHRTPGRQQFDQVLAAQWGKAAAQQGQLSGQSPGYTLTIL